MTRNFLTLLISITLIFSVSKASAQTTGTYIVTDNGPHMSSCEDSMITLEDIYVETGIRDLNDPNDNVSMYRILRLDGSLITSDEITGSFPYSAYSSIYIEKTGTPFTGHNGVVIYLTLITPPTKLFDTDTLKYVVEKGTKVNYLSDFFSHTNLWSSNKDVLPLQERILFTDMSIGTEVPVSQEPGWGTVGKGLYRIRMKVAVCRASDIMVDTIYIKVTESPCYYVEVKNLPPVCRDEVIDISSYIYIDGQLATPSQLADITFYDRSYVFNQNSGVTLDPASIDISSIWNKTDRYPSIGLTYQPNVDLGVCAMTGYTFNTKVPTKFINTDLVMVKDNYGKPTNYTMDGVYYAFNNSFHKNALEQLYLKNFNMFSGTSFSYFTDDKFQNAATGSDLLPGDYFVVATNPDCTKDSTVFNIQVKNQDFEITWMYASNLGKGYHVFTAPSHANATYSWMVWGGSIVAGLGTEQITVYYSENASKAVAVECQISLSSARLATENGMLSAAVYLMADPSGTMNEIDADNVTGIRSNTLMNMLTAYPNPAENSFAVSGEGTFDMKVYNMLGMLVYEKKEYKAGSVVNIETTGMHLVSLERDGIRHLLKVMLK